MRRVIIAGSRSFEDFTKLSDAMYNLFCPYEDDYEEVETAYSSIIVLCGMAKGADLLGYKWADEWGVHVEKYPADWEKYGKGAGFMRNTQMADNADTLVAFWDGESRGTLHMIQLAIEKGLEVHVYRFTPEEPTP